MVESMLRRCLATNGSARFLTSGWLTELWPPSVMGMRRVGTQAFCRAA